MKLVGIVAVNHFVSDTPLPLSLYYTKVELDNVLMYRMLQADNWNNILRVVFNTCNTFIRKLNIEVKYENDVNGTVGYRRCLSTFLSKSAKIYY